MKNITLKHLKIVRSSAFNLFLFRTGSCLSMNRVKKNQFFRPDFVDFEIVI